MWNLCCCLARKRWRESQTYEVLPAVAIPVHSAAHVHVGSGLKPSAPMPPAANPGYTGGYQESRPVGGGGNVGSALGGLAVGAVVGDLVGRSQGHHHGHGGGGRGHHGGGHGHQGGGHGHGFNIRGDTGGRGGGGGGRRGGRGGGGRR